MNLSDQCLFNDFHFHSLNLKMSYILKNLYAPSTMTSFSCFVSHLDVCYSKSHETYLYAVRHTCAVHTTGHINCVSPNIILRLACTDNPSYHWSNVQAWESKTKTLQWINKAKLLLNMNLVLFLFFFYFFLPIFIWKLLKECSLMYFICSRSLMA